MDCLACGTPDTRVAKSLDDGGRVRRKRYCKCGATFFSDEVADKKTLRVTNGQERPAVTTGGQQAPPFVRNNPPAATSGHAGGVGVGLPSGSVPESGSESLSGSLFVSDPGEKAAPARVSIASDLIAPYQNGTKGFPLGAFTMDFTAVYRSYASAVRGDARNKAALAWHEIAETYPGGEGAMRKGFEAWFATARKRHPYCGEHSKRPFLASVIAEVRWQDDQSAPDEPGEPKRDVRCEFHRRPGTNEKRAPRPSPSCPECKHVDLREWTRTDDPEDLSPAFQQPEARK